MEEVGDRVDLGKQRLLGVLFSNYTLSLFTSLVFLSFSRHWLCTYCVKSFLEASYMKYGGVCVCVCVRVCVCVCVCWIVLKAYLFNCWLVYDSGLAAVRMCCDM